MKLDRVALYCTSTVLGGVGGYQNVLYSPYLRGTWHKAIEQLSGLRQRDEVLS